MSKIFKPKVEKPPVEEEKPEKIVESSKGKQAAAILGGAKSNDQTMTRKGLKSILGG
mgnify:CR=1 FL=1